MSATSTRNASARASSHDVFDNEGLLSHVIAEQLTYMEFDLFKRVRSEELIHHVLASGSVTSATQSQLQHASPLTELIHFTNSVCAWVVSSILEKPKAADRALVVAKFVDVCKVCLAYI
jgi:hypothetical protein